MTSARVCSGRSSVGVLHDGPEQAERLRRGAHEIIQREGVDDLLGAGEVRVDLKAVEIADHEQRRVLQRLSVLQKLLVGGLKVLVLALVLPAEVVALPDIGKAVAAVLLLGALLKGVPLARGVSLVGRLDTQHPAQVDEVLLGGSMLVAGRALPLRGELRGTDAVAVHVGFLSGEGKGRAVPTEKASHSSASTTTMARVMAEALAIAAPAAVAVLTEGTSTRADQGPVSERYPVGPN